ncbi:MAG: PAS domain S-box protein [Aquificae bacterium]|nr:PAS domain S-box protein [Aquificota bacterium]
MLRLAVGTGLIIAVLLINVYYNGIREEINYSLLIPNVVALIFILIGYQISHRLKNIKSVYLPMNAGFIFLIISQSFLVAHFLTNQSILTLSISEIFVKLPGIILTLTGFAQWIRVKEERERILKEQEEKWKSIIEGVNEIIVIIQNDRIRYVNSKIKRLLGYEPEDIRGKPVYLFLPEEEFSRLKKDGSKKVVKLKTAEGSEKVFEVNPSIIPFEGKPAFLGILRDITDKVKREQELLQAKKRIEEIKEKLHEAQKLAKVGYWEVHLPDMEFYLSQEAVEVFNCPADKCSYDFEAFLQVILPQYRDEIRRKRFNAIKNGVPYEAEYKVETPAGVKIIREKVKILNNHRTVLGIVQDITEIHQIYQKVAESEERYRNLFEYSNDAIIIAGMKGSILDANRKALYQIGYSKFDMKLLNIKDIFGEGFRRVYDRWLKKLQEKGHIRFEAVVKTRDRSGYPAEVSASVFEIRGRKYIQLIIRDISERKNAERELKLASMVFENALEGIMITDRNGQILRVNEAFSQITGYGREDLVGWNVKELSLFYAGERGFDGLWGKAEREGKWQGELTAVRKGGGMFPVWLSIVQVKGRDGVSNYILMVSDITTRKHKEKKLKDLAYYDNLTKLPNRVYLMSKIRSAVEKAKLDGTKSALFFLDLDGFKQVNDTYGHEVGDKLLQEVAKRLRGSVRKDDFVARLGGDEFVILIEGVSDREVLEKIAKKIINSMGEPFFIDGKEIRIGTSIGISIMPDDAKDGETFLKHADFAMYRSKQRGKNRYTFYLDIVNNSQ